MKFCLQLNPQVAVDKPAASLLPTLTEQVRIADAVGFDAFSMGDHYNIPGLQRLNQVPALARLCAEAKNCAVGTAVMLLGLRHPVTVASELASLDVLSGGKSFAAFGLGYRDRRAKRIQFDQEAALCSFRRGHRDYQKALDRRPSQLRRRSIQLKDVSVDPKPLQKPRPPIWIAANTDAAVRRAAQIGDGWMIGPHSAIDELQRQVVLCRDSWSAAGKPGQPAIPIIRETFVAASRKGSGRESAPLLRAALSSNLRQMEAKRSDE